MSDTRPLSVRFSARPVESFRGPWAPLEDVFSDPGVAMDFVRHLTPSFGPAIVRAKAVGGTEAEREEVVGDWLCDDGPAFGRNARLPQVRDCWWYSTRSEEWAESRDGWPEAWETCVRASWLVHAAGILELPQRLTVLAACACAKRVAHLVTDEAQARQARTDVRFAEAWAAGLMPQSQMGAAPDEVRLYGGHAGMYAALYTRAAAQDFGAGTHRLLSHLSSACSYAERALDEAGLSIEPLADGVRSVIGTLPSTALVPASSARRCASFNSGVTTSITRTAPFLTRRAPSSTNDTLTTPSGPVMRTWFCGSDASMGTW